MELDWNGMDWDGMELAIDWLVANVWMMIMMILRVLNKTVISKVLDNLFLLFHSLKPRLSLSHFHSRKHYLLSSIDIIFTVARVL